MELRPRGALGAGIAFAALAVALVALAPAAAAAEDPFVAAVRAAPESPFTLTPDGTELHVAPGDFFHVTLHATNDLAAPVELRYFARGPLFEWAAFMEKDRDVVPAGGSADAVLTARVPTGTPAGTVARFEFAARAPWGDAAATFFDVVVVEPSALRVEVDGARAVEAAPGERAVVPLSVTNDGTEVVDLALDAFGSEGWRAVPSARLITLQPGDRAAVNAVVDVPADAAEGATSDVSVVARDVATGVADNVAFSVTVRLAPADAVIAAPAEPVVAPPRGDPPADALRRAADSSAAPTPPLARAPAPSTGDAPPPLAPPGSGESTAAAAAAAPARGALDDVAAVAVAAASVAGVGVALGLLGVALYTRLTRSSVLDHPMRSRILDHLRRHPGEHFSALRGALGLPTGCLTHHLGVLERSGFVTSRADGHLRRLFVLGAQPPPPPAPRCAPLAVRVAEFVAARPDASPTEVARAVGASRQAVTYHLKRVERGRGAA